MSDAGYSPLLLGLYDCVDVARHRMERHRVINDAVHGAMPPEGGPTDGDLERRIMGRSSIHPLVICPAAHKVARLIHGPVRFQCRRCFGRIATACFSASTMRLPSWPLC